MYILTAGGKPSDHLIWRQLRFAQYFIKLCDHSYECASENIMVIMGSRENYFRVYYPIHYRVR